MKLDKLFAEIAERDTVRTGRIGLASEYVSGMSNVPADQLGKGFDWAKQLRKSANQLVYSNGGLIKGGWAKDLGSFGQPVEKDFKLPDGFNFAFEMIISAKTVDRDGDVLYPKGCKAAAPCPVLWQHMSCTPIGKTLSVNPTEDFVGGTGGLVDVPMARDAAVLVKAGALAISHGFRPEVFEPRMDPNDQTRQTGWDVKEWEMVEVSLVSVPSNREAVITAFADGKLFCPAVKSWAKEIHDGRPVIFRGGVGEAQKAAAQPNINVTVNVGTPAKGKKADGDEEEPTTTEQPQTGDQSQNPSGETQDTETTKDPILLSDIRDKVNTLSTDESLNNEAQGRLQTILGMFDDVENMMTDHGETIQETLDSGDLVGQMEATAGAIDTVIGGLVRIADELGKVAQIEGVSEGVISQIADIHADVEAVRESMSEVGDVVEDVENEAVTDTEGDGDGDPDPEDSGNIVPDVDVSGDDEGKDGDDRIVGGDGTGVEDGENLDPAATDDVTNREITELTAKLLMGANADPELLNGLKFALDEASERIGGSVAAGE